MFQQAICVGPINDVRDVLIQESMTLDDANLNADTTEGDGTWGALRIDVHKDGGVADQVAYTNAPRRANAKFHKAAYATVTVRTRRDDPVFSECPNIQFLIEGRTVRDIVENGDGTYSLTSTRTYSTNPVRCLVDYLVDFKKVDTSRLNLKSMFAAKLVCDRRVYKDDGTGEFAVAGNFWSPVTRTDANAVGEIPAHHWVYVKNTDGSYSKQPDNRITRRALPLYECNLTIDLKRSHRDNINGILETMGDARLVWSQGQYKLNLQYPGLNNENIIVEGIITDDDLVIGKEISITEPTIDERYNSCTVSFQDEQRYFKTNTVTWPPQVSGVFKHGVNGIFYAHASGWDDSVAGAFMQKYAIRPATGQNSALFRFRIFPKVTGTYTLRYVITEFGYIKHNNVQHDVIANTQTILVADPENPGQYLNKYADGTAVWMNQRNSVSSTTFSCIKGETLDILVYCERLGHENPVLGAAATLAAPDGSIEWNTRDCAYTSYEDVTMSTAVYDAMKAEDHGLDLSAEMHVEGITDEYHAMALAEARVRTSRSAAKYNIVCYPKDKIYEPGDIIQFKSEDLDIGMGTPLYLRVENTRMQDNDLLGYECVRFDGSQLAWNVTDNKYAKPPQTFDNKLYPPMYLVYSPPNGDLENTSGMLSWPAVGDARVVSFRCYYVKPGEVDVDGFTVLHDIGGTTDTKMAIPALALTGKVAFAVRSVSSAGNMSEPRYTEDLDLTRQTPMAVSDLTAIHFGSQNQSVQLNWTIPELTVGGAKYSTHAVTNIYRGRTNVRSNAQKIGEALGNSYVDTPQDYGTLYYWVELQTYAGVRSASSNTVSITVDYWDTVKPPATSEKPPSLTNVAAVGSFSSVLLSWSRPLYTVGGGHAKTLIYAHEWPLDTIQPAFSESYLAASVTLVEFYRYLGSPGVRYVFWLKEQANSGAISENPTAPVSATCDLIGSEQLQESIIELKHLTPGSVTEEILATASISADKLKAAAVTTAKLAAGAVGSTHLAVGSVRASAIYADAVGAAAIAADAILARHISTDSIYAKNIAADAITTKHLKAATIIAACAAFNEVWIESGWIKNLDAQKITTGYLSADRLEAASITATKLSVYELSSITARIGELTSGVIRNTDNSTRVDLDAVGSAPFIKVAGVNRVLANGKTMWANVIGSSRMTLGVTLQNWVRSGFFNPNHGTYESDTVYRFVPSDRSFSYNTGLSLAGIENAQYSKFFANVTGWSITWGPKSVQSAGKIFVGVDYAQELPLSGNWQDAQLALNITIRCRTPDFAIAKMDQETVGVDIAWDNSFATNDVSQFSILNWIDFTLLRMS
jgi:hypothetical protein